MRDARRQASGVAVFILDVHGLEDVAEPFVSRQQTLDLALECEVALAGSPQKRRALGRWQLKRTVEDVTHVSGVGQGTPPEASKLPRTYLFRMGALYYAASQLSVCS